MEQYIEIITINLIPGGMKSACHAKQYDKGRVIRANLVNGLTPYSIKSGDVFTLNVKKPDGNIVTVEVDATEGNTYVDFSTTEQMCAVAGKNNCEFSIENGSDLIGTANFFMIVEASPLEGGIESESEINNLTTQIERITEQVVGENYYSKTEADNKFATKTVLEEVAGEVDTALATKADIVANKYLTKTPVQTYSNYRMSYRATGSAANLCYIASDTNCNCKAYKVTAGETYKIQAYGYDVDSFYIGAIGEDLVSGGQTTPTLQPILCGGSVYPTDYTNHVVEFTAQYTGYLYLNERPSTGVSAYAKGNEQIDVRNENGLIIKDGKYTHFVYLGEGKFLIREFTRRGPNNLFQLVHVGIGYFANNVYVETKSFMTTTTDIIGPFSIDKVGWSGGQWTGGNHSVTVNGVACPTAEQLSLSVTVNNEAVSDNGTYYGDVKIIAKNKLYFAQTITGNTFTGATPAILETRLYNLTDTMNVEVYIELLDDVRFSKYHGMQYVNSNVVNVVVPDDETVIALADLSSNYSMTHKQPDIILQYTDGEELHMILHSSGLGSYAHNNGNEYYGLVATYSKTYHTLISGEVIDTGKKLYWSGEYRMIV